MNGAPSPHNEGLDCKNMVKDAASAQECSKRYGEKRPRKVPCSGRPCKTLCYGPSRNRVPLVDGRVPKGKRAG